MDNAVKQNFINLWKKYFDGAELPICFFYTDDEKAAPKVEPPKGQRCIIADIAQARKGKSILFTAESVGCFGAKKSLGFPRDLMPDFECFLSCGIPGKMEGERYKKTPELVKQVVETSPVPTAPNPYVVFKRWDKLNEEDKPEVVIVFGTPDVISGLFTLSNYDEADPNGVFSPWGAGCASIIMFPYFEKDAKRPRGVLGMFDVSARPCVPADVFTFATPMNKFLSMINNMEESFLTTASWKKVQKRIAKAMKKGG
jgi:hypothetical protein